MICGKFLNARAQTAFHAYDPLIYQIRVFMNFVAAKANRCMTNMTNMPFLFARLNIFINLVVVVIGRSTFLMLKRERDLEKYIKTLMDEVSAVKGQQHFVRRIERSLWNFHL